MGQQTTGDAATDNRQTTTRPFGAIPLNKLRPSDIDGLVLAIRAKTRPAKGEDADPVRAFSDSTIRQTYTVLRAGKALCATG